MMDVKSLAGYGVYVKDIEKLKIPDEYVDEYDDEYDGIVECMLCEYDDIIILDNEEIYLTAMYDISSGERIYTERDGCIIPLERKTSIFKPLYDSIEEVKNELTENFGDILNNDFDIESNLVFYQLTNLSF